VTEALEEEEVTAVPALFFHVEKAYKLMLEQSEELMTDDFEGTVGTLVVYKGFITRLITHELSLSAPYYSKIMQALEGMGCVRQIRRGGNTAPSEWEMLTEPTESMFRTYIATPDAVSKPQGKIEMLQDQVNSLVRRVGTLEENQRKILEALT
jgi:hypothetical protein